MDLCLITALRDRFCGRFRCTKNKSRSTRQNEKPDSTIRLSLHVLAVPKFSNSDSVASAVGITVALRFGVVEFLQFLIQGRL